MIYGTQQHSVFISIHKATQLRTYVAVERLNKNCGKCSVNSLNGQTHVLRADIPRGGEKWC